jgi:hypothetical protein
MTLRRVASPVNDQIGAILDFAERTGDFATQLGGYLGWTVSERGVAINYTSNQLGQGHRLTLGLTGNVAEAVHQRHVGLVEVIGSRLDRVIYTALFAIDQGIGVQPFCRVVLEPTYSQNAGILGMRDALGIGVQLNIITDATAKRASRVLHNVQFHRLSRLSANLTVRTGRNSEGSTERSPSIATPNAARHVASDIHFLPAFKLLRFGLFDEMGASFEFRMFRLHGLSS